MQTLRAKFALLLIVSIVSVIALITLAMMYVFTTPKSIEVDLMAKQLVKKSMHSWPLRRLTPIALMKSARLTFSALLRVAKSRFG